MIRDRILADGTHHVAALVVGSRAIPDSEWEKFSTDYDIVTVDFLGATAVRKYSGHSVLERHLSRAFGKKVTIASLILPNLNLRGNVFVRKMVDQKIVLYGSEKLFLALRNSIGGRVGLPQAIFYILTSVQPLLYARAGNQMGSQAFYVQRQALKAIVACCEINLLLENPGIRLPSAWRDILSTSMPFIEKVSLLSEQPKIVSTVDALSSNLREGNYECVSERSTLSAAFVLSYRTLEYTLRSFGEEEGWPSFSLKTSFLGNLQFVLLASCHRLGFQVPKFISPNRARRLWMDIFSRLHNAVHSGQSSWCLTVSGPPDFPIKSEWHVLAPFPSL